MGVGNVYCGDDAVGLVVVRQVKAQAPDQVRVLEHSGEGAALLESWKGADAVVLVDAVFSGGKPGMIYQFDAHAQPIPAQFFRHSTHAFSVAEAIELARVLHQLPPSLTVYGIEGRDFQVGKGLSQAVAKAVPEVVQRVLQQVQ
ncbi:MAG: hydrogenase maturation protease [Deinococcus sp.]|nr:hydrogenase maturation protease [Deinococcus sp.]